MSVRHVKAYVTIRWMSRGNVYTGAERGHPMTRDSRHEDIYRTSMVQAVIIIRIVLSR
jgi:hypothetical protein